MRSRNRVRLVRGARDGGGRVDPPTGRPPSRSITIPDVRLVAFTDNAILVAVGGKKIWLPNSQVRRVNLCKPGDVGILEVPAWLLNDKGIN